MTVNTRPVVVIGLGKTGLSVLNYLHAHEQNLIAMDTRANPPALADIKQAFPTLPIYLGDLPEALLLQAREIVVSPGLSLSTPAIAAAMAAGISVVGDIELFARVVNRPVVAITGSNGKSTVTSLLGHMAKTAGKQVFVGGNLGIPVLDALTDPTYELYILELSSFQLETTYSLKPIAATILNITPDHMDRYADFAAYKKAKQRIYQNTDIAIYNRDDIHTQPPASVKKQISFGKTLAACEWGLMVQCNDTALALGNLAWLPVDKMKLRGQHNMANALAALALGHVVGLPQEAMLKALTTFQGLPHRSEWVGHFSGVDWYNDSKGTNVDATLATLIGLGAANPAGKIVLIAGGEGKGADFSVLATAVQRYVRQMIVFGKDAMQLANALQSVCTVTHVEGLQQAVLTAKQVAQAGDIVLLSPACASLDMFINFEHRGAEFVRLVKEYVQ